jgi:hypothetical protein
MATEHVLSRPEPQFMPETPVQPIGPYIARHRSTETVSLGERFIRSDFGRSALRVVVAAGLIGGPVLANAVPAAADTQNILLPMTRQAAYIPVTVHIQTIHLV